MRIAHRRLAAAARQIRVHHAADDRSRPDDGHLDDQIVEVLGPQPRQRRHLRARLHLEHADRVGLLEQPVDLGIVGRQMRQIQPRGPVAGPARVRRARLVVDDGNRLLQHRHHAEAEQVHLDDPQVGAVVLVPLHDHASRHRGVLERHDLVEPALADHHAARVLAEMPRQVLQVAPEPAELPVALVARIEARLAQVARQRLVRIDELELPHQPRDPIDRLGVEPQDLADLARGAAAAVRDHVGRHGGAQPAVALVDVLDDALAPVAARQIEIDVRPLARAPPTGSARTADPCRPDRPP